MERSELLRRLSEYGADMEGISGRFRENTELYEECFLALFEDSSIPELRETLTSGNYEKAFGAAHALKGVTGNLGLTPLYDTICVLVESLRAKDYSNVKAEYAAVLKELKRTEKLLDETPAENPTLENEPLTEENEPQPKENEPQPKKPEKKELTRGRLILLAAASLLVVISLGSLLFSALTRNFGKNIAAESASHLEEINYQIKLYIEGEIENDWQVVYSVRNAFIHNIKDNDVDNVKEFLTEAKSIWEVDDIIIYTDDGTGMRTDGSKVANDVASSTMYNANLFGEHTAIVQSTIVYTIPIESGLRINDAKVVAISVERNLQSFLDSMDFSSFGGAANIYLTQSSGKIISQLTTETAAKTFNIVSEFEEGKLTCLSDSSLSGEDVFAADEAVTFSLSRKEGNDYVVITPIETRLDEMQLVYIVPDVIVNQAMDKFSNGITHLSVGVLFAFSVVIVVVFLIIYQNRKKQFDKALISRERTFDLLVKNTQTAFALISTKQKEPIYTSANAASIVGEAFGRLLRTEKGFRFVDGKGEETEALSEINRELANWDGKSCFTSGYIARQEKSGSGYYEIYLYPVAENRDECVAIIQDVTQQFIREDATKNALDMAEKSNAAKSRFLSNMSHDIRTPMNAIVNMTKFAKEKKNEPELLDQYLDTISESSDHLLQLINDVLDVSRIESGQAVIESVPFNIKSEMQRLADIILPLCQSRNQFFRTDFDDLRDRNVLGDKVKLSQILMNLLGNAVKFTQEGGTVFFSAEEITSLRAGIASIRFTVSDNGIGIPKKSMDTIFDPFVRVDDKRISKIEGTGLGLSICQSYVNAMGGTIKCESEEGEGSTFTVELFFEETEDAAERSTSRRAYEEIPFAGKNCLLCEDNEINQRIAKTMLENLGMEVDIASDGKAGATRFELSAEGRYDIIYMDIQMPEMDGYEASAAIRESGHPQAKTIPIVAMTANVFAEDVEKARIAGMNGHLGKPINIAELISETDKLINKR